MNAKQPPGGPVSTRMDTAALQKLAERHQGGYRSVGVMAYDIIRDAILDGTLAPGQKLRQETLADSIGISRLPIRSALIQLEAEGLVEFHERRGAVVKTISIERAKQVYDARTLLEVEALRRSMASMTPDRLERIRERGRIADDEKEGADFLDARAQFYAELYDAEAQPVLWELIEQLRLKVGRYMLGWRLVGDHEHGHSHQELVDAAASGDSEHATEVLRAHLDHVGEAVLQMLRADGAQEVDAD